jgi:hypothetical protein
MSVAREYLLRELVPQSLVEKMLQRSSTEIYWLTQDDTLELSGRAPWFDEMMIARCQYDPTYDRATMLWATRTDYEHYKKYSESGVKRPPRSGVFESARYTKYLQWKQEYNSCEYASRRAAQAVLR